MNIRFVKIDSKDPYSAYKVYIDNMYQGAVTASVAQDISDHINIQQANAEYEAHKGEHGADDWQTSKEEN